MANTPNKGYKAPTNTDTTDVIADLAFNFTKIDTDMKSNEDNINTHKNNVNAHTSENISHADGSVKATLDNHGTRITSLEHGILDITSDEFIVNVKQLGALGDGTTDDTAAIQTAFDLARDNGNVKLFFPEGTYCISGTNGIRIYKNTTVELHPSTVLKRTGTGNKMFMNGEKDNATYATGYNGDGNIHFSGGTIDLNQSTLPTTTTLSCFDLGHGENISFTQLKIKNGQIGHYFQVSSCKNVRFTDCWFGDVVYSDQAAATYEVIQIEEATPTGFSTFGSYDQTPSRDIYIERCTFQNVIRAVGTHSIGYNVFGENINIMDCTINNAYDNAISLWKYKNVTVENTLINGCQYGIHMHTLQDSNVSGNVILNTQKSGFWLSTSSGNKFSKNTLKEIGLAADGSNLYYGIQMQGCTNNTFDDDTVYSAVPKYTYAWYSSNGSTGNKILSHNYTGGLLGTIGGVDATEIANIQIGNGQTVLFDGDLAAAAATGTLLHDIRNFSYIVVLGNNNGSATASLASMIIPKLAIIVGASTSRFRMITGDSVTTSTQFEFSFPTGKSIQLDVISGTPHIRKIIGIV